MSAERPWVDGLTIADALRQTADRHPAHDALVFPQLAYRRSYAEFHAEVREVARALLALGGGRGAHVGVWATNLPQWVLLQFAAAYAGAVLVNINPAYRAHELAYVLHQADITTLFLTDRFRGSSFFDTLAAVCPELADAAPGETHARACPTLRRVISVTPDARPGMASWQDFRQGAAAVSDADLDRRRRETAAADVANIQYTSGTTGFPKGAMLTHRNLLLNAYYVGQRLAFGDRDRLALPVPFYHCFGCSMGTLMCAVYGAAMVVPAESFDAGATLQAIQD